MLPVTRKTLCFLLLLFDNLFISRAGKWKECSPDVFGNNFNYPRGIVNNCYALSTWSVTFAEAKRLCLAGGSKLAEPESYYAALQVIELAKEYSSEAWIGVEWIRGIGWTLSTTPLRYYLPWGRSQPDGDGICGHMWARTSYYLNDIQCWSKLPFACMKPKEWTECLPNPCQNDGACNDVSGPEKYKCTCLPGSSGKDCSEDIDECASSPCKAINTTCQQTISLNQYICICGHQRVGKQCQYEAPDMPTHNCEPQVFVGDTLTCTCSTKKVGDPQAIVGFLLGEEEYTPKLVKTDIATSDDGMEFTCGFKWMPPGEGTVTGGKKYKLAVAYGPTDRDTSITGPTKVLTDGQSSTTVTLTCSSFWVFPQPIVQWEEVECQDGNQVPECRFTTKENIKQMNIFCTLKSALRDTVIGKANHTLTIDSLRKSVISIRVLRIGENDDQQQADAGQSRQLVCEAFGGDPRPFSVEVYHTPGVKELRQESGGTQLTPSGSSTPQRAFRKTYSIKASDICGSTDLYRCETKAELEGDVIMKFIGLTTNCSKSAPEEVPNGAPVAPIAAGTGSSLLGLLGLAFLLWKRRNQQNGTPALQPQRQEEEGDDVFLDNPSEAAPTENPTESALPAEEENANEASTEQSEEAS